MGVRSSTSQRHAVGSAKQLAQAYHPIFVCMRGYYHGRMAAMRFARPPSTPYRQLAYK